MPPAAPGDERAVLAEFCTETKEACQHFAREVLADSTVQAALSKVRFVQFDFYSVKGMAAYEHFDQTQSFMHGIGVAGRLLGFLGIVEDRAVRRYAGPPFDARAFVTFIADVPQLGGTEQPRRAEIPAAPNDAAKLARAA